MTYIKSMVIKRRNRAAVIISVAVATLIVAGIAYASHQFLRSNKPIASHEPKTVIFSDEFSGNTLDANKWVTCYNNYSLKYGGCTNYGNWESEWYKDSQVAVSDGYLKLTAKKETVLGDNQLGYEQEYPYISGMVSSGSLTKNSEAKWGNTYGYYEARILSPFGQGVWPAFWLLPVDTSWPPEIDIMEVVGDRPNELINTYFWKGTDDSTAKDSSTHTYHENLSNDWHVYAVDWQPGSIQWYLDDELVYQVNSDNVPSKPMHIVLNLAIGGTLPGDPDETTPAISSMLVDYVRVYKDKPKTVSK